MPRISVIVPAYNAQSYLAETLDSVISQSFEDWECIVVNDGSKDNTESVAMQYCQKDKRIKYVYQPNGGPAAARNNAINNCSGDFLLPLDADDIIHPAYLQKALEVFDNNPQTDLVYCKARFFGDFDCSWEMEEYNYERILNFNHIFCTCLFRREDAVAAGMYDESFRTGYEDWDFLLRLLSADSRIVRLDEELFFYRQHGKDSVNAAAMRNEDPILDKIARKYPHLYGPYKPNIIHKLRHEHDKKVRKAARSERRKAIWQRFLKCFCLAPLLCMACYTADAQWDKDVFSWRGRRALQEGRYAVAIENFNVLASLDTTDYWTFFFRGIAKYNLGDLRGAQTDFNTSVRLNPVFTNGYHYRAIIESRTGYFKEAFADYDKALALRPGSEGLYYSRGVSYFLNQQFDKAVSDFNRYLRKQPKDPSAYLNRGASFLYLKDTTAALNDYNKAIQLDRFEAEAYVRRGRLYGAQGRTSEAIEDMNKALDLNPENTFALFNRALLLFDNNDYVKAMNDLNKVLELEPGNALTLYNRGLVKARVGDYSGALDDLDRVVNINPENVLVYFNRASVFIQMHRFQDALEDYNKAIELYPDFAKAYMSRSYVKNELKQFKGAKEDYDIAQRKVAEYRAKNLSEGVSLSDTTQNFASLLALDADFAGSNFNDELLQHRDVDVKLRPMYRFVSSNSQSKELTALKRRYDNQQVNRFIANTDLDVAIVDAPAAECKWTQNQLPRIKDARSAFLNALYDCENKQFNSALANYDIAVAEASKGGVEAMYLAFYLMNRAVLRSEMIDFMSSIQNNVQVLTMDESGNTRAKVRDHVTSFYDFSEAIEDLKKAEALAPDVAYISYDLANMYCLAGDHISAIAAYTRAIALYPYLGDAYFNRAIVQIYLQDKEKGCNDLSVAGELGVKQAYSVIKKYCNKNEVH